MVYINVYGTIDGGLVIMVKMFNYDKCKLVNELTF